MTEGAAVLLRGRKPIVAVADSLAASAAYWIASQADEVVATPSALVGSVGVVAAHVDESRVLEGSGLRVSLIHYGERKVDGASSAPLSDRARADIQRRVDTFGEACVSDVAAGRGVPVATVRERYGRGGVLVARDALAAGVVDRIATLEDVVGQAAGGRLPLQFRAQEAEMRLLAHRAGLGAAEVDAQPFAGEAEIRLRKRLSGLGR